jgi:hypothetical protein
VKVLDVSLVTLVLVLLAGCAKMDPGEEAASRARGERPKSGSSLAYEHLLSIAIPKNELRERIETVRSACLEDKFGSCSMLEITERTTGFSGASGSIVVRLVPDAVEPMSALASDGARVDSKTTRAEDLAETVADTAREKEQLQLKHAKLVEFQARKDLSASDMISLSAELSSVEIQLANVERVASENQRRIETNLLTFSFFTEQDTSSWSSVRDAFAEASDAFVEGLSEAIYFVAFGAPSLLVAFPLALLWRYAWRRITSRRSPRAS